MNKRALIFGCSGQDGSYLAEHLLDLGYEVYGVVRRHSEAEGQNRRILHLYPQIQTFYGDLTDPSSIRRILSEVNPDFVYNLAGMSQVRISFEIPEYTSKVNALGFLSLLEAVRSICPKARIYQASSSEMFGNCVDLDGVQRLTTPMKPVSPYGCSKLFAYSIARNYREAYGMFVSNGILFNHESPRRGSNFVSQKIVKAAVDISQGGQSFLELGNLDSQRDWGHAKDYVRAMEKILSYKEPDDFIVATGETHSVRHLCELAFNKVGLDYHPYVKVNPKFLRPSELHYLKGDPSKAQEILGWKATTSFESLVSEMVEKAIEKEAVGSYPHNL